MLCRSLSARMMGGFVMFNIGLNGFHGFLVTLAACRILHPFNPFNPMFKTLFYVLPLTHQAQ